MITLKEMVRKAVECFMRKDSKLLEDSVHEQAVSHRIAVYLEFLFRKNKEANVDCEYNKHLEQSKKLRIN